MLERDPILLTPGPLTTSRTTRDAMLHDRGAWDAALNQLTRSVCADLVRIAGGGGDRRRVEIARDRDAVMG